MRRELSIYLDLTRILAAMLVFTGHADDLTNHMFHSVGNHARGAVAIFFVLSGFVISFVARTREQSTLTYACARAVRIYSVAIPALLVTFLADSIGWKVMPTYYEAKLYFDNYNIGLEIISSMLFIGEFWNINLFAGSNQPYWSINFEVWYYILFGIMIFGPKLKKWLLFAFVALVVGPKVMIYFPLWLLGALCYSVIDTEYVTALRYRIVSGLAILASAPLPYLIMKHLVGGDIIAYEMYDTPAFDRHTFHAWAFFLFLGLSFSLTLLGVDILAPYLTRAAKAVERPIRWFAGATFTIYLTHLPILLLFAALSSRLDDAIRGPLIVVGTLIATLFLAEVGERRKNLWRRLGILLLGPRLPNRAVDP